MSVPFADMNELLSEIRRRPTLYLGGSSIARLWCLLWGFWTAEECHQLPMAQRLGGFEFEHFERWVTERFNPKRLSLNSFTLAREAAGSDEAGFGLWFQWYDEYRRGQAEGQLVASPSV